MTAGIRGFYVFDNYEGTGEKLGAFTTYEQAVRFIDALWAQGIKGCSVYPAYEE